MESHLSLHQLHCYACKNITYDPAIRSTRRWTSARSAGGMPSSDLLQSFLLAERLGALRSWCGSATTSA